MNFCYFKQTIKFLPFMKRTKKNNSSQSNSNDSSILNYFKSLRDSYSVSSKKESTCENKIKIIDEKIQTTNEKCKESQKLNLFCTENSAKNFPPFLIFPRELSETPQPDLCSSQTSKIIRCTIIDFYQRDHVTHIRFLCNDPKCTFEGYIRGNEYILKKAMDIVIIGSFNDDKKIDLTYGSGNYMIIYPYRSVSITNIGLATKCIRQAYLCEMLAGLTLPTAPMLVGSLGHCLIQFVLAKSMLTNENSPVILPSIEELRNHAKLFLQSFNTVQSLYSGNIEETEVLAKIEEYYQPILDWAAKMLFNQFDPSKSLIINDCMVKLKICAIEDYIVDDIYGLKGRVDITCQVVDIKPLNPNITPCLAVGEIVPIEIKTGKIFQNGNLEHRAQAMMYCMGLANRYDTNIKNSLLFYIKSGGKPILVTIGNNEKEAFINKRNLLVGLLENLTKPIPEFSVSSDACKFCPVFKACHLHAAAFKTPYPYSQRFPSPLNCSIKELEFFKNLYLELSIEVAKSLKNRDVVNEDTPEIDGNAIKSVEFTSQQAKGSGWLLTFERKQHSKRNSPFSAFSTRSSIVPRCAIIGRMSPNQSSQVINQFMGFVHSVDSEKGVIVIQMENPLSKECLGFIFDIDLMITNSISMLPMSFITQFFTDTTPTVCNLRNLIVNQSPPVFDVNSVPDDFVSLKDSNELCGLHPHLNISKSQLNAIFHCLKAKDYALLWGLPGTGKTTTIASLLYILNKSNKKVLVTSHTNAAVDNILLKLLDLNVPFLRIGKSNSVHNQISDYTLEQQMEKKESWTKSEFESLICKYNIFATTCMGVKNAMFERIKYFDVCIVDEATQVHLPLLLGSLMLSKSFILVGDHHQMSPLTLSTKCELLRKSLFESILEHNESSVVALSKQFRMHPSIGILSSNLFYNGRLQPDEGALVNLEKLLQLDNWDKCTFTSNNEWMKKVLDPTSSHPVVFIDHSYIQGCKMKITSNSLCVNNFEAAAAIQLVQFLVEAGMNQNDIGVLSTYTAQVAHIKSQLMSTLPDVEVHTIDRFQGRDKECIILSLVSNRSFSDSSILGDYKRLNVALTRARRKLIILGNYRVIGENKNFNGLLEMLNSRNTILYK